MWDLHLCHSVRPVTTALEEAQREPLCADDENKSVIYQGVHVWRRSNKCSVTHEFHQDKIFIKQIWNTITKLHTSEASARQEFFHLGACTRLVVFHILFNHSLDPQVQGNVWTKTII